MRKLITVVLAGCVLVGLHAVPANAGPPNKTDRQTVSWEEQ